MKARPTTACSLLGTEIILDPTKVYECSHASNQPEWKDKGMIFIHERPVNPVGVLLERGEYDLVE